MFLQQIVLILSCGWPVYLIEPSKWFYQILEKSTNLTILGYESYTWVYKTSITGYITRVWRYQRGNHNPYYEEEQTTQWPKEKVQKDKQRSTKCTHKTKDRVTWTPLKTGGELGWSGRVSSSCFTSDTRNSSNSNYKVVTKRHWQETDIMIKIISNRP